MRTPWFGLTGLVLLATLLAAIFVQIRQQALLELTIRDQDDYTVISLHQLEIEYLRLREALQAAAQPDVLGQGDVQLRYDIFLSRVSLLDAPRAQRLLAGIEGAAPARRAIDAFNSRAEVYLGPQPRALLSPPSAAALRAELDQVGTPLHRLLLDAAHVVAGQITERREQVRQHNQIGMALTGFLSAMVLIYALVALRQMRMLDHRRRHLETLAQQLRDARAAAEAASAAKTTFLADMSHELRTPMQGLQGMLTLLADAPRDPRAAQWLATADESARHLQRLLDDLLDLSRLEAGTLALVPHSVLLQGLIDDTAALMRPEAEAKGLQLDLCIDDTLPRNVRLDATRVKQVLFNLLHNAIKYSEAGQITLRVRSAAEPDGAPMIAFEVVDNGIGMDSLALAQLFQRYTRVHDPQVTRQAGTGLGLAISRNLAQLMGGDLQASSAPGNGSVFTFRCPMLPAAEPDAATTVGSRLERCLRILVAEDHPINRMYLGALLDRLGHQSHHVVNGQEAVESVREQPFDLVLMDVHMPLMDGVTATQRIRELGGHVVQPHIVALTADAFADTRERCLAAGVDEVVSKPLSAPALGELLQRHFGVATQVQAPAPAPLPSLSCEPALIDHVAQAGVREAMGPHRSKQLYAGLFEQAVEAVRYMHEAMRAADLEALRQHAHAVKGASLNLGLPALADAAATISGQAHAMAAPQLALAVQRFDELVQATRSLCIAEGLIGE